MIEPTDNQTSQGDPAVPEKAGLHELTPAEEAVAVLAHELRGPLAVVLGYLGILERPIDAEAKEHAIGAARRAAQRMDALIDDVLGSLYPAPDRALAPRAVVNVREIVSQAVADLPPSDILVVVVAEDDGLVLANEPQFVRAFGNVLGNAIKFSPGNGTITVSVANEAGRVLLKVEDEGPGIPAADRERVFLPFERLARDSDTPGTGLGLGLVRTLIEAQGGSVSISARAEAPGACVVIDLPCAPE